MSKSKNSSVKITPAQMTAQLQQAMALHQQGALAQAEAMYQALLGVRPQHVDALHLLGILHVQTGRIEAGIELIRKSISINGYQSAPHSNLGNALMALQHHEEAIQSYNKAIALKPDYAEAYNNRGNAFNALGRYREALASYDKALALRPDLAETHSNRGNALRGLQRHDEALASYDQALARSPGHAEAHMNKGTTLVDLYRHQEALACYDRALALNPSYAQACTHKGNVLRELGRLEEAAACHQRAIALAPGHDDAYGNLGVVQQELGQGGQAIQTYRSALAINPGNLRIHSNLLFAMSSHLACSPQDYLTEARHFGELAASKAGAVNVQAAQGPADRPLRVGLVSGDLKNHPVGFFLEAILTQLDPSRIELVAYATHPREDDLTQRIKPLFAHWRMIAALDDRSAADLIAQDRVDILVDLAGHTAENRLPLFAWKPAPVQVSWLGYFASTGLASMDYLLADAVSVPPDHESHFTETIWRLPETRLCLSPPAQPEQAPVAPPPALEQGYVTFGCFQNMSKMNTPVLDSWARVMQALPEARLLIQNKQMDCAETRALLMSRLSAVGVDPGRVMLRPPLARHGYLNAYAQVDILLDTFPYPGGTTTCEALWMGVPTVTLAGETLLSRQGASILTCAGLADWITEDVDGYVAAALRHAGDVAALAALRSQLRARVTNTALFDARRFASHWQDALQAMWSRHIA